LAGGVAADVSSNHEAFALALPFAPWRLRERISRTNIETLSD